MEISDNFRTHTIRESVALVLGSICVFVSLVVSISKCDFSWFSRSGSLLVLFGAYAEYSHLQVEKIVARKSTISAGLIGGPVIPPKNHWTNK